jgi:hypothetical protein
MMMDDINKDCLEFSYSDCLSLNNKLLLKEGYHTDMRTDFMNLLTYDDKNVIPSKFKSIYVFANAKCPRSKIRNWASKHKASITRNILKADLIITPSNKREIFTGLVKQAAYGTFNIMDNTGRIIPAYAKYQSEALKQACWDEDATEDQKRIYGTCYNQMQKLRAHVNGNKQYAHGWYRSTYYAAIGDVEEILKVLNTLNKGYVIPSKVFNKVINEDSIVITDSVNTNLNSLFESKNPSDHVIAIETLANCHYEKSFENLCDLLVDHYWKIHNSKAKNHVHFKGLKDFLNFPDLGRISIYDMFKSAIDNDILTKEMAVKFGERIVLDYKSKLYGCSQFLKPEKFKFTNEVQQYFRNKNEN